MLRAMRAYDQIAEWYVAHRSPEVGVAEVEALIQTLPPGARVLDLGCGDGEPLSRCLAQGGAELTGLDSSAVMVARYRARFPGVRAVRARAQHASFSAGAFEAVVAWGVLFHLSEAGQRAVLEKVSTWLVPGGRFLFTSGTEAGEREGTMEGVTFRYVSLGVTGYRALAERAGLELEREHRDAWDNHVYVAARDAEAPKLDPEG